MGATLSQREDIVTRVQAEKWAGELFDKELFEKLANGKDCVPLGVFIAEARASKFGTKYSPSWSKLAKVVCGSKSKHERALGKKVVSKLRTNLREIFASDAGDDFVKLKASTNMELQKDRVKQITIRREPNESLGIIFRASSQLNVLGWSSRQYIACDNFKQKPDGQPTCGVQAGLQRGDILVTCEGVEIKSFAILKKQVSGPGNTLHWEVARPQEELFDEDLDICRRDITEEIIREMTEKAQILTKWQGSQKSLQEKRLVKLQRKIRERIAASKSVRAKIHFSDSKVTKKEKEEDGEKVHRRRKVRRRRSRRSLKTDNADEVQDTDDVQKKKQLRRERRKQRREREQAKEQLLADNVMNQSAADLLDSIMGSGPTDPKAGDGGDEQKAGKQEFCSRTADVEAEIEALRNKAEYVEIMKLIDSKAGGTEATETGVDADSADKTAAETTAVTESEVAKDSGEKKDPSAGSASAETGGEKEAAAAAPGTKPKRRTRRPRKKAAEATEDAAEPTAGDEAQAKPRRKRNRRKRVRKARGGNTEATETGVEADSADKVTADTATVTESEVEKHSGEKENASKGETKAERRPRRKRSTKTKKVDVTEPDTSAGKAAIETTGTVQKDSSADD